VNESVFDMVVIGRTRPSNPWAYERRVVLSLCKLSQCLFEGAKNTDFCDGVSGGKIAGQEFLKGTRRPKSFEDVHIEQDADRPTRLPPVANLNAHAGLGEEHRAAIGWLWKDVTPLFETIPAGEASFLAVETKDVHLAIPEES